MIVVNHRFKIKMALYKAKQWVKKAKVRMNGFFSVQEDQDSLETVVLKKIKEELAKMGVTPREVEEVMSQQSPSKSNTTTDAQVRSIDSKRTHKLRAQRRPND